MTTKDYETLTKKPGFKVKKIVKYLGMTLTNINSKLFQNNFVLFGMISEKTL